MENETQGLMSPGGAQTAFSLIPRSWSSREGSEGQSWSWAAGPPLRAPASWSAPRLGLHARPAAHTVSLPAHRIPCRPWPWAGEVGTLLWLWSLEQVCDICVLTWIVNRPSGLHEVSVRKWTTSWRFGKKKKVQLWAGDIFQLVKYLPGLH